MDYESMDRRELQATSMGAKRELANRQTEDVFRQQLSNMQDEYVEAFGDPHEEGETWTSQTYPLLAYRVGDIVFLTGGTYWRSLIPGNQFSPEDRGWRQINQDGSTRPWVKPELDHDGYMTGERAIRGGIEFESTRDYVLEEPSRQAYQWVEVSDDTEGEDETV